MEKYRVRGDGLTSHFAAFGTGYTGEVVPFGESCFFKVPMGSTRQIAKDVRAQKADSTFTRGIWVGKHDRSDDHVFLTAGGWHRARTVRRLPESSRMDRELFESVVGGALGPAIRSTDARTPSSIDRDAADPGREASSRGEEQQQQQQ